MLEAAAVGDTEQEIGIGEGLQLLDAFLRGLQFGPEPADSGLVARPSPFGPGGAAPAASRNRLYRRPSSVFHGHQCLGLLMKACRNLPRQDSAFLFPYHALPTLGPTYKPAHSFGFLRAICPPPSPSSWEASPTGKPCGMPPTP